MIDWLTVIQNTLVNKLISWTALFFLLVCCCPAWCICPSGSINHCCGSTLCLNLTVSMESDTFLLFIVGGECVEYILWWMKHKWCVGHCPSTSFTANVPFGFCFRLRVKLIVFVSWWNFLCTLLNVEALQQYLCKCLFLKENKSVWTDFMSRCVNPQTATRGHCVCSSCSSRLSLMGV